MLEILNRLIKYNDKKLDIKSYKAFMSNDQPIDSFNKDTTLLHFELLACGFFTFDKSKEYKLEQLCNVFHDMKGVDLKSMYKYLASHEDVGSFDEVKDYFQNNIQMYPIQIDIVQLIIFNMG